MHNDLKKVALLTTSFGAGHLQAAQAVEHAILNKKTGAQTKLIDSFTTTAPRLTRFTLNTYLNILASMPLVYKVLYDWGNNSRSALYFRQLISSILAWPTSRQLAAYHPDVVVCTHASPTGAVCHLKKKGVLTVPVIAVVTDYVAHRLWVYDEVDLYAVAHENVRDSLISRGIDPLKIMVTGIPVADKFNISIDKNAVLQQLALNGDAPIILIMGGGTGALPMGEIVSTLKELSPTAQLLVVTGNNKVMRKQVEKAAGDLPVRILGFVANIHELMSVADLMITKPGGLSVTEAITMGLPMVIFRPIPGQEEGNAKFLIEQHVAYRAEYVEDLPQIISALLYDQDRIGAIRQRARILSAPKAAETIADLVLEA
jgi:processive 1,2-diacylglycerol beta-glucosyltransferase